ncbi:MAG: DEAD/DEAH box helicase [Myxococcales bacterium]|nr:DEAD/DEAH box helicase [Myxococcales bacterium]
MRFEEFELAPEITRGIEDAGFVQCTPIQEKALPWTLDGHDVAAQAQTGTGKTATFLLTVFSRLLENGFKARPNRPRAICIAPTRELALQIASDAAILGRHTGFSITTIYGGVGFDKQRHYLEKGLDLCIATPGRLIDFVKRGECKLDDVEVIVVDEADRLFDMGFYPDLRYLLRKCPSKNERQMLVFSATLSFRVIELSYEFMLDSKEITVEPQQVVVRDIEERIYHVGGKEKIPLLVGLIRNLGVERTIIFCNTKVAVDVVARSLVKNGIPAEGISGDLAQASRVKVLDQFKSGDLKALVASDVASRGLHVDGISHVFNYDVPQDPEDYVHRIGRTARAGATGVAVTFACEEYVLNLPAVEHFIGHKIPVFRIEAESIDEDAIQERRNRPRRTGGVSPGGRPRPGSRSGSSGPRNRARR